MTRPVLVVNPVAGGMPDVSEVVDTVREACGADPEVRETAGAGDARRFAARAVASGADEIWIAGGDGTLHEVALGLGEASGETRPTLVPLPLGTGNDLVRSLGIPLDWREAAAALGPSSRITELDRMEVRLDGDEGLGLNAVIAGNGGRVGEVLDADGKSRWGPLAYLRSAAEVALELQAVEVTLRIDDGPPRPVRILNVVVANGGYAGHGIPIAPGARPDDGRLELVVVREAGLSEVLGMLPALLQGGAPEHEAWTQRAVTSVRIDVSGSRPIPVSVDGENGAARQVSVTLAEGRLPVRIPEQTREAPDAP